MLTQLGLIVATPAIVGAAARLGRFLPLAPRLALRDAARHRGRTAPAVAAVLGAVAGSVALTLFVASLSDKDERNHTPSLAYGQALLRSDPGPAGAPVEAQLAAVRRIAPPDGVVEVRGFPHDPTCTTECRTVAVVAPPERRCPVEAMYVRGEEPTAADHLAAQRDERCTQASWINTPFAGPVVGGYDDYVRLVGAPSATARAAIEAGGMVVFDADHVVDGRGEVEVSTYDAVSGRAAGVRSVRLPAVHVPVQGQRYVTGWLSPQAAARVGVPVGSDGTVVTYACRRTTTPRRPSAPRSSSRGRTGSSGSSGATATPTASACWRCCSAAPSSPSEPLRSRPAWHRPTAGPTRPRWPRSGPTRAFAAG